MALKFERSLKVAITALVAILALSLPIGLASVSAVQGSMGTQGTLALSEAGAADVPQCLYFFYDSTCSDCQEVYAYLQALETNSTWLTVHYFEVRNLSNFELMVDFYHSKNMTSFDVLLHWQRNPPRGCLYRSEYPPASSEPYRVDVPLDQLDNT